MAADVIRKEREERDSDRRDSVRDGFRGGGRILGDGPFHGAGGPMTVDFARDVNPSSMAFIAAGEQLGLPVSGDLNGADRTGFGIAQSNIRDGVRHSVVDGYLRPALGIPVLADLPGVGANLVMPTITPGQHPRPHDHNRGEGGQPDSRPMTAFATQPA